MSEYHTREELAPELSRREIFLICGTVLRALLPRLLVLVGSAGLVTLAIMAWLR